MIPAAEIVRPRPLHQQIREAILARILRGALAPGTKIVESEIARDLGVSRTPLREALMQLERDGFLELEPNRGFSVSSLSSRESAELYPILGLLEARALRDAGRVDASTLRELERLNRELARCTDDPETAVQTNFRWHEALLRGCPNAQLLGMIEELRRRVFRYEYAYFAPGKVRLDKSIRLHEGILSAIRRGRRVAAARRLEEHWLADLDSIIPAMQAPNASDEPS